MLCLLAACGSHRSSGAVATVGKQSITTRELNGYLHYVVGFDALAYPDSAEAGCSRHDSGPACRRLHNQALVRLMQERLVIAYARQHGIALTSQDRAQVDAEVAQLSAGSAPTRTLFQNHTVTRAFMRDVLSRQLLVQKVQEVVAGRRAARGTAYRVRKLTLKVRSRKQRVAVFQQALAIVHGGVPSRMAHQRVEWVAPFRLTLEMDQALERAHPGQYLGPFEDASRVTVIQLLARRIHRYGAPARRELAARYFHSWLRQAARQAGLKCSGTDGTLSSCPRSIINSV